MNPLSLRTFRTKPASLFDTAGEDVRAEQPTDRACNRGGKSDHVVFCSSVCAPNVLTPTVIDEFNHSFPFVCMLPCNVPLGGHPSEYRMAVKYAKLKLGALNPFVDPSGGRSEIRYARSQVQRDSH